jgi:hypothetical protein
MPAASPSLLEKLKSIIFISLESEWFTSLKLK